LRTSGRLIVMTVMSLSVSTVSLRFAISRYLDLNYGVAKRRLRPMTHAKILSSMLKDTGQYV
jgi:hypothetical protein